MASIVASIGLQEESDTLLWNEPGTTLAPELTAWMQRTASWKGLAGILGLASAKEATSSLRHYRWALRVSDIVLLPCARCFQDDCHVKLGLSQPAP